MFSRITKQIEFNSCRIIVYAITNYDIQTNEILTAYQLNNNNNKHTMGLNADLLKVILKFDRLKKSSFI